MASLCLRFQYVRQSKSTFIGEFEHVPAHHGDFRLSEFLAFMAKHQRSNGNSLQSKRGKQRYVKELSEPLLLFMFIIKRWFSFVGLSYDQRRVGSQSAFIMGGFQIQFFWTGNLRFYFAAASLAAFISLYHHHHHRVRGPHRWQQPWPNGSSWDLEMKKKKKKELNKK